MPSNAYEDAKDEEDACDWLIFDYDKIEDENTSPSKYEQVKSNRSLSGYAVLPFFYCPIVRYMPPSLKMCHIAPSAFIRSELSARGNSWHLGILKKEQ